MKRKVYLVTVKGDRFVAEIDAALLDAHLGVEVVNWHGLNFVKRAIGPRDTYHEAATVTIGNVERDPEAVAHA